jgi:hypothetical protein
LAFRNVSWTIVAIAPNGDELCAYARLQLHSVYECWICPLAAVANDQLRRAADVCFRWWIYNCPHRPTDVVMLMELDVLVRNVPLFLALLGNETRQFHSQNRAVTSMQSRDTMSRFCAADARLTKYCQPNASYLNGVALYSPLRLRELGVLRDSIKLGFDQDLGAQLLRINPELIGMVSQTLVCMLPLEQLERVRAWIRREPAPNCPAWHVFHYLWRPQLYSQMPDALEEFYSSSS